MNIHQAHFTRGDSSEFWAAGRGKELSTQAIFNHAVGTPISENLPIRHCLSVSSLRVQDMKVSHRVIAPLSCPWQQERSLAMQRSKRAGLFVLRCRFEAQHGPKDAITRCSAIDRPRDTRLFLETRQLRLPQSPVFDFRLLRYIYSSLRRARMHGAGGVQYAVQLDSNVGRFLFSPSDNHPC